MCRNAGLPEPEFRLTDGFVITLRRNPDKAFETVGGEANGPVTPPLEVLVRLLGQAGALGNAAIRAQLGLKDRIHLHMLAADGAFLAEGRFAALPPVPGTLLAAGFRRAVLDFLVKNAALVDELRSCMLAWRHAGFSAHNEVRVPAEDAEGRKKLAGYMLRAPMSLEKMTYDAATQGL